MSDCINNIVVLGLCDDPAPSSGFKLLDAAGISIKNLNNIADDSSIQGLQLAANKKVVALNMVRNDFLAALSSKNVVTQLANRTYKSSNFITNSNIGNYNGERGLTLFRSRNIRGELTKQTIYSVDIYGTSNANIDLIIYDAGVKTEYEFTLVNGQINTFGINYKVRACREHEFCRVVIDNNIFSPAQAVIECKEGCNNTMPNECGFVKGWDGQRQVKNEGYGININFSCECDYESLLCSLSKTYIGELIWLKWQELIFDEQYKTNRFDNWVIYNRDELPQYIEKLEAQYANQWNNLNAGLYDMLKIYRDSCLNCRNTRFVVNG